MKNPARKSNCMRSKDSAFYTVTDFSYGANFKIIQPGKMQSESTYRSEEYT
jgi:hypothetical protein